MNHPDGCNCVDCAQLRALERRLAAWTPDDLEAAVPDDLVAGMWDRVRPAAARPRWRWGAAPAWAAAAVLLVLVGVVQLVQVRSLQQRVRNLEVALAAPATANAAWPFGDRGTAAGLPASWQDRTVADMTAWLARIPPQTQVLGPEAAREWLGRLEIRGLWLRGLRLDDGLQAAEALTLARALDLPPYATMSSLLPRLSKGPQTWARS